MINKNLHYKCEFGSNLYSQKIKIKALAEDPQITDFKMDIFFSCWVTGWPLLLHMCFHYIQVK